MQAGIWMWGEANALDKGSFLLSSLCWDSLILPCSWESCGGLLSWTGLVWSGAVVLCWYLQVNDHGVSHCFHVQWPLWPRPPWSAGSASPVSASLGSSRAFVCFLHTSLQGTGFCEKAQGSSLRRCYSAHMSPITPTPNWIWSFALESSHPDWFCGYRPLALVLLNYPSTCLISVLL